MEDARKVGKGGQVLQPFLDAKPLGRVGDTVTLLRYFHGGIVELAQQFGTEGGIGSGTDPVDVGVGEDVKQFEVLCVLDAGHEAVEGLLAVEVFPEGDVAHENVVAHQEGGAFAFLVAETEVLGEGGDQFHADFAVVLFAPLARVVKQNGQFQ